MPSQQPKPSNSQRNFVFAKIQRLNRAIVTAIEENDHSFDLEQSQRSLEHHFAEAEQMTMYLVDHLPEDITEEFLIGSFTDLQDLIDETVKKFKRMMKKANHNANQVEPSQIQLPSSSTMPLSSDSLDDQLVAQNSSHPQQLTNQPTSMTNPFQASLSPMSRPKIKIEPFSGDPMKWNTWHGLFSTLIDKQPLSVAEKMTHLQTLTTGQANDAIAGFSCNPDMYPSAMEELKRRFGRPDIIVSTFLAQLQTQRPPSTHHKDSFMEFSSFLNNLVETFQSLGFHHDLQSTVYVQFALNKLHHKEQLQWSQYVIQNHITQPNLIIFNTWLRDFALACDHMPTDIPTHTQRTMHPREEPSRGIIRAPHTGTSHGNRPSQTCPFDKQPHHPSHCNIFTESPLQAKRKLVQEHRLCLNCLGSHLVKDCPSRITCKKCQRKHHTALHDDAFQPNRRPLPAISQTQFTPQQRPNQTRLGVSQATSSPPQTNVNSLLITVPVTLEFNNKFISTYAFLDMGSSCSYLQKDIAHQLSVPFHQKPEQLLIGGFHQSLKIPAHPVSIRVHPFGNNNEVFNLDNIFVVDHLNLNSAAPTTLNSICQQHEHLQDISFPILPDNSMTVLLGQDNFDLITPELVIKGHNNSPRAIQTKLGWTVAGPNQPSSSHFTFRATTIHAPPTSDNQLYDLLASFWKTENYATSPEVTMSKEEKYALTTLKKTTTFKDGRYEVGLLWHPDASLPNNFAAAIQQFKRMKNRLSQQPNLHTMYQNTIDRDIEKGYIRKLEPCEVPTTGWILPEHGVYSQVKDKLRRVSNAAAKYKGTCLNDMLLTGPDLLANLVGVVLRFRQKQFPIAADIEGMYMQVSVRPQDRKFLRFLWGTEKPEMYEYLRHVFGAKCSPTCANHALQTCSNDHASDYPFVQRLVHENFYVDDFYLSTDTISEAIQHMQDLRSVLQKGGFNLTKWVSTNEIFLRAVPAEHRAVSPADIPNSKQRILGIPWTLQTDTISANVSKLLELKDLPPTQRTLLRIISSQFDPLGITAPIVIRLRIIQQSLWRKSYKWDDHIANDDMPEYNAFVKELETLCSPVLPRHLFQHDYTRLTLHVFCDASYSAFAAVAYFVYDSPTTEDFETTFVLGKARVAPLKQHTITKLELQAAVLGTRIAKFIHKESTLPIIETFFWSDSSTVIQWIRNSHKRQQIFIANRVSEILETSTPTQWRHCPGDINPADDATRGIPLADLTNTCRWFTGPSFLTKTPANWPAELLHVSSTSSVSDDTVDTGSYRAQLTKMNNFPINVAKFSSWFRLVRVTAFVYRALRLFRISVEKVRHRFPPYLTAAEYTHAKTKLLQFSQTQCFFPEISAVKSEQSLPTNSRIKTLTPYICPDGFLRAHGRLEKSHLDLDSKRPIILDGKHPITQLLILATHHQEQHAGLQHTRHVLQQTYWIVSARSAIRRVLTQCYDCRRQQAHGTQPQMSLLPEFRFPADTPFPFRATGLDHFGPFAAKTDNDEYHKRYALILTCLTTRAVHLEMCPDVSTAATINALRRFFARRGTPALLVSDNASNFVAADTELQLIFTSSPLQNFLANREIKWKFNPPHAPHFGGVWERLIRSCKDALYAVIGSQPLTDDTFATVLNEIEAFLNNRPITDVSTDINDTDALTPNHFLLGRAHINVPPGRIDNKPVTYSKRWKYAQQIADHVWNRLIKEYLPTLLPRQKWIKRTAPLKIGQTVWILKDLTPRGLWPIGRITAIDDNDKEQPRQYIVKTTTGTFRIPAIRLAPVEAEQDISQEEKTEDEEAEENGD